MKEWGRGQRERKVRRRDGVKRRGIERGGGGGGQMRVDRERGRLGGGELRGGGGVRGGELRGGGRM